MGSPLGALLGDRPTFSRPSIRRINWSHPLTRSLVAAVRGESPYPVNRAKDSYPGPIPGWRTCVGGFAVNNSHISAGNVLLWPNTQAWTGIAAIKVMAAPAEAGIIMCNVGGVPQYPGYEFWINPGGFVHSRVMSDISVNDYIGACGSTNVCDGKPHVIAVSYDGSKTFAGIKIFVDGVADTTTSEGASLTGTRKTTGPLWVGNQIDHTYGMNGYIGWLSLSNIVRSSSYIASNANVASIPAVDANTVLQYRFQEATGTTTADESGSALTGTLSSSNIWSGQPIPWQSTKYGMGLVFNHSTNYFLDMGSPLGLSGTSALSIFVRVRHDALSTLQNEAYVSSRQGDVNGFYFYRSGVQSNPIQVRFGTTAGAAANSSNISALDFNVFNVGVTVNGTAVSYYGNGKAAGTGTCGAMPAFAGSICLGAEPNFFTDNLQGALIEGLIWNRVLSATEHADLALNPGIIWEHPSTWRVGPATTSSTSVSFRRTSGPRVGSRSVY